MTRSVRNAAILSFITVLGSGAVPGRAGAPRQVSQPTPAPAATPATAPGESRPAPASRPVLQAPSGPKVRIGLGTDPVKVRVSADGGFGLTAMRQRVEGLSGTLEIESEAGAGTAVSACIPAVAQPALPAQATA